MILTQLGNKLPDGSDFYVNQNQILMSIVLSVESDRHPQSEILQFIQFRLIEVATRTWQNCLKASDKHYKELRSSDP
jgi:hypothetical protein